MKPSEILMNALDIIDTPGKWTQRAIARTAPLSEHVYGECAVDADGAVCFCSRGAIMYASGAKFLTNGYGNLSIPGNAADTYLLQSSRELFGRWPAFVNDHASSPFDKEMSEMWLGAIFNALADESE